MSIEAMKQALKALEKIHAGNMTPMAEEAWNKAITSLRQAIAEAEKAAGKTPERMRKPGEKGAPTAQAFKDSAKTAKKK
ncbi:MAG: hypothetical protein EBR82_82840 [Caulobacteraceae bacterium]|nr:hypothetical protein [Caulobacteraceae bacterium]